MSGKENPTQLSTEDLMNLRDELREKTGPYHRAHSTLQRQLNAVEKELDLRIFGTELLY